MSRFYNACEANFQAFCKSNRTADIIAKKQEIMDTISTFHNLTPTSILFVGFSSFIMARHTGKIFVTGLTDEQQQFLNTQGVNFTYIPEAQLDGYHKKFQAVVAVDEYFTYADSDTDQRNGVYQICNLASEFVITTLKDYKNQDYKDREFSLPTIVKMSGQSTVFLEAHEWNPNDRNAWTSQIFQIDNGVDLVTHGKFDRRVMYFKQLAKFSADAGAHSFLVHKNLMYKGLVKKNYEHVITMKFE